MNPKSKIEFQKLLSTEAPITLSFKEPQKKEHSIILISNETYSS